MQQHANSLTDRFCRHAATLSDAEFYEHVFGILLLARYLMGSVGASADDVGVAFVRATEAEMVGIVAALYLDFGQ